MLAGIPEADARWRLRWDLCAHASLGREEYYKAMNTKPGIYNKEYKIFLKGHAGIITRMELCVWGGGCIIWLRKIFL